MKRWFTSVFLILLCSCQNPPSAAQITITPSATWSPSGSVYTPVLERETPQAILDIQDVWAQGSHATGSHDKLITPLDPQQVVECKDCHESIGGILSVSIAYWNPQIQQYQSVPDSNTLCRKCHVDIGSSNHQPDVGKAVHKSFECTDCHDPHSTMASCSNSTCHANILPSDNMPPATPTGGHPTIESPFCGGPTCHPAATEVASKPRSVHGSVHAAVTCQACHDASGIQVGPEEGGGPWITWQTPVQSGNSVREPYFSHQIQLEVDCTRCHFSNNPWKLQLVSGSEFVK